VSTTDNFFGHQKDKSRIKTLIVTDFFKAYFPIINNSVGKDAREIIYIDLFCGPGKFDDGEQSTPLALLDVVNEFRSDDIRNKLRIVFNDENSEYITKLETLVGEHEVRPKLKHHLVITNKRAGEVDLKVHTNKKAPIFSFIDPWGYKDVSAEQTWELVKNIGSDCVLFFNSNRFLMDISKETQARHFEPIFGSQLSEVEKVVNDRAMGQKQKTQKIVELFSRNLCDVVSKSDYSSYKLYVLPFSFEADDKEKTSHHIVFITKSHKAIIEMKKVMLKHSNSNNTQLGFDSKDQLQISLFNREDFVDKSIIDLIKQCFINNHRFINKTWTIATLLQALDACNMSSEYQVTPYSCEEVKGALKVLDKNGVIEIIVEPNKKIRENITNDRNFKIKKELLV
jgi:three-Cys-motif partner protein